MTVAEATAAGEAPGARETYFHVTCSFCGLRCDDLEIERVGKSLTITKNACVKARAGFERPLSVTTERVGGKPASLAEAISAAAALIRAAEHPAYGGLAVDVAGMRAVMSLADQSGGAVDHAASHAQYRNFQVLQTSGWFMTTLTEARNRADLFIITASDIHTMHPRFFERVVCAKHSMFEDPPKPRTVVFLGEGMDMSAAVGPRVGKVVNIRCTNDRVGEVVSALRTLHRGAPLHAGEIAGVPKAAIVDLLERCHRAAYGVFVWAPPSLAFPSADLLVHQMSEFIKDLNAGQRFAGLSLGGNEGATTAAAVCAWQSGYPLRVSFQSGKPIHDPENYWIPRMLETRTTDCLVWIATFTPDLAPPATDVPTVVIGTHDIKLPVEPSVFIPVGSPGIDYPGQLVRCDSVVSLPLRDLGRNAGLPRPADVLAAIQAAL